MADSHRYLWYHLSGVRDRASGLIKVVNGERECAAALTRLVARPLAGCSAAMALQLASPSARAEPALAIEELLTVTWTAPPGCPDSTELLARVRKLLITGKPPAADSALSVDAEATQSGPEDWTLAMTWRRAQGPVAKRTISAKNCEEVVAATALFIALAIDPQLTGSELAPLAPGGLGDSESDTSPPEVTTNEAQSDKPPPRVNHSPAVPPGERELQRPEHNARGDSGSGWWEPIQLHAGAGVTFVTGWLPTAAPGLSLLGTASSGKWSIGLKLAGFLPREKLNPTIDAGGEFWLGQAALTTAYAVDVGKFLVVAPALGVAVNVLYAKGTGSLSARDGYSTAVALITGARLRRPIGVGLTLVASADASFAGVRPSFSIGNGGGEIFRPVAVGFQAGLGAEARFR